MNTICVPIIGPTLAEAAEQVTRAREADLLELRLDRIRWESAHELTPLLGKKPVIFTLKGAPKNVASLMTLRPDYVDIEVERFLEVRSLIPEGIQVIASYHDHAKTPEDLEGLLHQLKGADADYYKLATKARSAADALRMLHLCRSHPKLIGICMGRAGIATRILAPLFGVPWTYASLDPEHASAPGQLPIDLLLTQYRYRTLSPKTQVLGVMGNPVDTSPGVPAHNRIYEGLGIDAVYLPFTLNVEDLPDWFSLAADLGIFGMSVTMPLKEAVLPYLQQDGGLGAVNTLIKRDHGYDGANFDGVGALEAIGDVTGKDLLIIGAGGAAAAIAFEAQKRGARVVIVNRTPERAQRLAVRIGASWAPLDQIPRADIVIQCTSVGMEPNLGQMPIPAESIPKGSTVLEIITRPVETAFLQAAESRGCKTIRGTEMWKHQAARQLALWFGIPVDQAMREVDR